jgi:hypothetical protein
MARGYGQSGLRSCRGAPGRRAAAGLAAALLTLCGVAAFAVTRNVPGTYATIQDGINAASAGDVVLVASGTYTGAGNKDLDFLGKAITVRSAAGAASCIIDCQGSGRGFFFHSGETASSVLEGFTITNGYFPDADDWRESAGGGIWCQSSPWIRNCIVSNSTAAHGGGIYIDGEDIERDPAPLIENCIIRGNTAHAGGEHGYGGGIWVDYAMPTIVNCLLYGNSSKIGGGIATYFAGNPLYNPSPVTIKNCTVSANTVTEDGGGLDLHQSRVNITNCIVWNNTAAEVAVGYTDLSLTYSNVQGGFAGTGNIDQAPLFAGPTDFQLNPHSPGIDAGNGSAAPATDILGNGRVDDLSFPNTGAGTPAYTDMGAYESQYSNTPPTANAGADQVVNDADRSGGEAVVLNGTASFDPDGSIAAYAWKEGSNTLASGATPTVALGTGTHTITLTVTDNEGATASDAMSVKVNVLPTADAGPDQVVADADRSGAEAVALNGSGSSDGDGGIVSYLWTLGGAPLGSGAAPTVVLGTGAHTITLTVTDSDGAASSDTLIVRVESLPLAGSFRCEGEVNPDNVSTYTPTFSWAFSDADAGDGQSAYQLGIDTVAGGSAVWDTGMVLSGAQGLVYGGSELLPNTLYHWSVQVWDQAGNASGWLAAGTFVILDIGLRIWDGEEIVRIAVDYASAEHPLRIHKNGTNYGIILVDPSDPSASRIRIMTGTGVKALKRM